VGRGAIENSVVIGQFAPGRIETAAVPMAAHDCGRAKCGEREGLAISQKKSFSTQMAGSLPNLHTMVPRRACIGNAEFAGVYNAGVDNSAPCHHVFPTATMSIIKNSYTVGGLPEKLIAH